MFKLILSSLLLLSAITLSSKTETTSSTLLGTLNPKQTKEKVISFEPGQNTISLVSDDNDVVFSCQFIGPNDLSKDQEKVTSCSLVFETQSNLEVKVKFTNETDHLVDYQLVHTTVRKRK